VHVSHVFARAARAVSSCTLLLLLLLLLLPAVLHLQLCQVPPRKGWVEARAAYAGDDTVDVGVVDVQLLLLWRLTLVL
jgi:hypothetical protein